MKILNTKEQIIISGAKNRCECHPDGRPGNHYLVLPYVADIDTETCKEQCCCVMRKNQSNIIWIWYESFKNFDKYNKVLSGTCTAYIQTKTILADEIVRRIMNSESLK